MLPLIYLIGAGLAGVFFSTKGFGFWGKDENGKPIREKKLAVLGPSNSGKTLFFNYLKTGKISDSKISTFSTGENIESFRISDGDRVLVLKSTLDVPGNELAIRTHYSKLVNECSDIFFVFNCLEFLEDNDYRTNTLAMVDYINRHNSSNKLMIFLGTHVDQLLKDNDSVGTRKKTTNEIVEHLFNTLDHNHINEIDLINMLDESEMKALKNALFK